MKRVDIETLVRWAYRDELPKVAARPARLGPSGLVSGAAMWAKLHVLNTLVQEPDIANRYGVLPLLDDSPDDVHPDAVRVAEAVEGLARLEVCVPDAWHPLGDMGDLGPEGADAVRRGLDRLAPVTSSGARIVRHALSRLVIRHAILGAAPSWQAEVPTRRMVCAGGKPKWFRRAIYTTDGAFGPVHQTLEIEGFNAARQRPFPGAYRKFELDPDPVTAVVERGEHELWVSALALLAETLSGALTAHVPLPPARPARPWEGEAEKARILPSFAISAPDALGSENKNSIAA
ncbi:MAG: hypothetical protein B7Z15_01870 [Rhizobiales bacterium 32-66-8]|nr:MAG: hypothetical protein B7Z15_01870 [Rhizobiales bacterium 32-66-8]